MNYQEECWSCHKQTMDPEGSFYRCSNCGATWNEQSQAKTYLDVASDSQGAQGSKSSHPVRKSGRQIAGLTKEQGKKKAAYSKGLAKGES